MENIDSGMWTSIGLTFFLIVFALAIRLIQEIDFNEFNECPYCEKDLTDCKCYQRLKKDV